jgi:hypothetical protein
MDDIAITPDETTLSNTPHEVLKAIALNTLPTDAHRSAAKKTANFMRAPDPTGESFFIRGVQFLLSLLRDSRRQSQQSRCDLGESENPDPGRLSFSKTTSTFMVLSLTTSRSRIPICASTFMRRYAVTTELGAFNHYWKKTEADRCSVSQGGKIPCLSPGGEDEQVRFVGCAR